MKDRYMTLLPGAPYVRTSMYYMLLRDAVPRSSLCKDLWSELEERVNIPSDNVEFRVQDELAERNKAETPQ